MSHTARARANALKRTRPLTDPVVIEAERECATESIERYVTKRLAEAPPLNADQFARLRGILRPSAQGRAAGQ